MPSLLKRVFGRIRSLSWGQRGYALIVLSAVGVFGYAGINDWRARSYAALDQQIAAAGARSTRSLSIFSDPEEAYFLALQGDLSAVAVNGVIGSGPGCTVDAALLRRLSWFPDMTMLTLTHMPLKREDYQAIYGLENLTQLNLSFDELTDADLVGIEKLENLETLELQFTLITDASLPRLEKLPGLIKLDISDTDITPAGAERLRRAYRLIHGASQATNVIHRPSPSPRYRSAVTRFLPSGIYSLGQRGGGMRLHLQPEIWNSSEQDIPLIAELVDVESVNIQGMPLSPPLLDALAALPKIRHLSISETSLTGMDLSKFAAAPNLRSLRLTSVLLDEAFVSSLTRLESLEQLVIFNSKMQPGACRPLAKIPSVRTLYLRQIDADHLEFSQFCDDLAGSPNLHVLDIAGVPFDGELVRRLGRLRKLQSLGIGQKEMKDDAVPELCTFTHLRQLDITGSEVTQAGALQLESALAPGNTVVVHSNSGASVFPLEVGNLRTEFEGTTADDQKTTPLTATKAAVP